MATPPQSRSNTKVWIGIAAGILVLVVLLALFSGGTTTTTPTTGTGTATDQMAPTGQPAPADPTLAPGGTQTDPAAPAAPAAPLQ